MAKVANPHDKFFRQALSEVTVARDFLKVHVPDKVRERADWNAMQLVNTSFIDAVSRDQRADVLYTIPINGQDGYIYTLLEHQSTEDPFMAFRMMMYSMLIMSQHLSGGHKTLPVVVPLCIYHGKHSPYPYSTDILDLFEDKDLASQYFAKPFQLIDYTIMPDSEAEQHGMASLVVMLQKHIRDRDILTTVKRLIEKRIIQSFISMCGDNSFRNMLLYLCQEGEADVDLILSELGEHLPENKGEIMTIADQLRQQGMQQGMQQGVESRNYEIARALLSVGDTEQKVVQITGLSYEAVLQMKKELFQ